MSIETQHKRYKECGKRMAKFLLQEQLLLALLLQQAFLAQDYNFIKES